MPERPRVPTELGKVKPESSKAKKGILLAGALSLVGVGGWLKHGIDEALHGPRAEQKSEKQPKVDPGHAEQKKSRSEIPAVKKPAEQVGNKKLPDAGKPADANLMNEEPESALPPLPREVDWDIDRVQETPQNAFESYQKPLSMPSGWREGKVSGEEENVNPPSGEPEGQKATEDDRNID